MKNILTIAIICLAFACNEPGNQTTAKSDTTVTSGDVTKPAQNTHTLPGGNFEDACYIRVTGRDTLLLHLKQTGEKVTGTMRFDNYEKDSSSGTVEGKMENGNLVLWYSFSSEGMHSYAQQILQPNGTDLLVGYGDVAVRNDTAYMKEITGVTFNEKDKLVKTVCTE